MLLSLFSLSLSLSEAWQPFYPWIFGGRCSYVGAIIKSARLAGTDVTLL